MKELMLRILQEAKDFDDFKARFVPALEEAIKQDADWAEMAEEICADMPGYSEQNLQNTTLLEKAKKMLGRDLSKAEIEMIDVYGEAAFKAICR